MENDPRDSSATELAVLDEGRAETDEVCACCTGGAQSART
jgi:putative radical SAM-modified peptide